MTGLGFDYKTPEWINKSLTLSLKKRSKLTKKYHMDPTASNKEALDIQSKEFTSLINESKDRYIAKKSAKLDNPKTVPKIYLSIKNKFLSNRATLSPLSNAAPFCKNYIKLYFDAKHLQNGLNRDEGGEVSGALFSKKVPFLHKK